MKNFENVLRDALINAFVETYGREAWDSKSNTEKDETLHQLLTSFLKVASNTAA